jgi:hypothetical protein
MRTEIGSDASLATQAHPAPKMPWRDWALSVAFFNACLIRIWIDLLGHYPWLDHRDFAAPGPALFWGAITLALTGGTLLWLALRWSSHKLAKLAIGAVASTLLVKEALLATSGLGWFQRANLLTPLGFGLMFALILGGGTMAVRLGLLSSPGAFGRRLLTALIPLTALTFGHSVYRMTQPRAAALPGFEKPAVTNAQPLPKRIVWIILDEIDEDVAFSSRPAHLKLPALDRFLQEAQFASLHAESPANATALSIPALLKLNAPPGESFFARAQKLGARTAVLGWSISYCHQLRRDVDACAWWPLSQQHNTYGASWPATTVGMAISLFESNQISPLGRSRALTGHIATLQAMTDKAIHFASRPDLDLVYLHLPVPHRPYVFNPRTGALDVVHLPDGAGYLNNLLLADRTFARLRRAMETSGVWARSTVILTGDHGFRMKHLLGYPRTDKHVPLMIKDPGPIPVKASDPVATIHLGDWILSWLMR